MNVTELKSKLLSLNLNKVEKYRVECLRAKELKFKLRTYTDFTEITDENYKEVWYQLNKQIAKEDKFHRAQTHSMRNSSGYVDYSHLAYNGVTEDF
jgi:hypothetical protein